MILAYVILFHFFVRIALIIRQYIKQKQRNSMCQEKQWYVKENWYSNQEYPNSHNKNNVSTPIFQHPELDTPTSQLVDCPGEIKETIHDLSIQLTADDADIIYDEEERKYIFDCYRIYLEDEVNYIDSQIGFRQLYST